MDVSPITTVKTTSAGEYRPVKTGAMPSKKSQIPPIAKIQNVNRDVAAAELNREWRAVSAMTIARGTI